MRLCSGVHEFVFGVSAPSVLYRAVIWYMKTFLKRSVLPAIDTVIGVVDLVNTFNTRYIKIPIQKNTTHISVYPDMRS